MLPYVSLSFMPQAGYLRTDATPSLVPNVCSSFKISTTTFFRFLICSVINLCSQDLLQCVASARVPTSLRSSEPFSRNSDTARPQFQHGGVRRSQIRREHVTKWNFKADRPPFPDLSQLQKSQRTQSILTSTGTSSQPRRTPSMWRKVAEAL